MDAAVAMANQNVFSCMALEQHIPEGYEGLLVVHRIYHILVDRHRTKDMRV